MLFRSHSFLKIRGFKQLYIYESTDIFLQAAFKAQDMLMNWLTLEGWTLEVKQF